VEFTSQDDNIVAMKFQPKEARDILNLINNVYVKNIPLEWTDDQVKDLFKEFGTIKSLVLRKNDIGQFGFVCFDDPKQRDFRYGPRCAQAAIDKLNDKQINDQKLYVRYAMKRADREVEKRKETLKYKTSKKRCNLYVKNFPQAWTED
jgi:polyadenylate-binding protein